MTTKRVLEAFAKGEKPKSGPQSGRRTSENSAGLTALTTKVCQSVGADLNLLIYRSQPYGPGEFCTPEFS